MRNQLTTTRPTQSTSEATIQPSDILITSSDNPTNPMPNTQTSTRAGRLRRRCHLAASAPAPARIIDGYMNSGPKAAMTLSTWSSPRIW